ncbi:MAG TPA: hypothetical protein H9984_06275 [Candidatus Parabacteroides faecavium]|nr:hypothetical protein [Candidatus Parabacteroides faecavium]
MNKKFSTLMAAALLAGSLPVVAQDTIWVKVNSAQLVNGAKYRITDTRNYPLVDGTATVSSGKMSWAEPAPILDKNHADPDSIWTLIKTDKGFTLKSSETSNPIYLVGDANGAAAQMYTNINKEEAYANLILNEDGTLSDATNKGLAHSYSGLYFSEADSAAATKFSFEMLVQNPSNMAGSPITALPEKSTTMHVIFEGKYVGISADTKALGSGLTSVESLPEGNADNYLWLYEDGALKNIANDKYLTVSDNGDLVLSDKAVVVSFVNNILSVNGNGAVASLLNSSTPLPFNGPKFTAVSENAAIVLYGADGKVYSADSKFEAYYDAQNSAKTVWTLTPVQVDNGEYEIRLVNAEYTKLTKNPYLTVNGKWVVVKEITWNAADGEFNYNGGYSTLMAGSQFVTITSTGLDVTSQINQAYTFGFGQIQVAYITANELLRRRGDHFTLEISYKDKYNNKVDVTGVFEGKLRPCKVTYNSGNAYYDKVTGTEFMLVNEEGNIIGIDLENPLHTGASEYGYKLQEITPKDYALEPTRYEVYYHMQYTPGQTQSDITTINKIILMQSGREIGLQKDSKDEVLVAAFAPQLASVSGWNITLNPESVVDAATWLNKPVYYTVESINKKTKTVEYGRYAGKVLGLNESGVIDFIAAENVDLTKPEGQFAITFNTTDGKYYFTNREKNQARSKVILEGSRLYKIDDTTFAYVHGDTHWTTPDTLSIKPVSNYSSEDGFHRISPADLNAKTYTVAMKLLNGDFLNIIENHNDKHRVGLDEENATEWRIEMPTVKLLDATKDFLRYAADTVKVETPINYYVDGDFHDTQISDPKAKYYYPNTELQICTYILKNTDTNEYLYGKDENESKGNAYYVCDDSKYWATRIALKENGDDTYNLVPAGDRYFKNDFEMQESSYNSYAANLALSDYKVIGGTTSLTGVLKDADLYEATSNDLFVVKEASAPTYKKMEQGDKIILSLVKDSESVLFENGEFASIGNRVAHSDINPTLYVDTAYVNRLGNFAYQYLLGVNINRVDSTEDCGNPNHEHPRTVFTEGRFLMNMVDSAKVEDENNVHNNKFQYNGKNKLAFVKGYHQNDTLYLTNDANEVVSKMEVGNEDFNIAKFAFKMIDEEANEFVVETGMNYTSKVIWKGNYWSTVVSKEESVPGYLRWVNGNLVVTDNIDEAAHFTMEASDKEATANEEISTSSVVVAGVDGAVVVKGAEGKNVIVSTILGKVVANEVVSSDNATIAAPAGIVVVSVDGESFKVVVK